MIKPDGVSRQLVGKVSSMSTPAGEVEEAWIGR